MHAEKIMESLNYAYAALTQGRDVQSAIRQAQSAVDKANQYVDGRYDEIYAALDRALIETSDAVERIETASADVNLNSNEQEILTAGCLRLKIWPASMGWR